MPEEQDPLIGDNRVAFEDEDVGRQESNRLRIEREIRRKVDLRLCPIAGILCSLQLLDSGIISSASVTSMLQDLGLDQGNRYSVVILIFTVSSVVFLCAFLAHASSFPPSP